MTQDYIDPAVGWPLAAVLWIIVVALAIANHRKNRLPEERPSLDCLDGNHLACEECDCSCHWS